MPMSAGRLIRWMNQDPARRRLLTDALPVIQWFMNPLWEIHQARFRAVVPQTVELHRALALWEGTGWGEQVATFDETPTVIYEESGLIVSANTLWTQFVNGVNRRRICDYFGRQDPHVAKLVHHGCPVLRQLVAGYVVGWECRHLRGDRGPGASCYELATPMAGRDGQFWLGVSSFVDADAVPRQL
jgi:hypothetical protein